MIVFQNTIRCNEGNSYMSMIPKIQLRDVESLVIWKNYSGVEWTVPFRDRGLYQCCWNILESGSTHRIVRTYSYILRYIIASPVEFRIISGIITNYGPTTVNLSIGALLWRIKMVLRTYLTKLILNSEMRLSNDIRGLVNGSHILRDCP